MDVKIILKIHSQQKEVNIFLQFFQCLQYRKGIESKHDVETDCMKKICESLREHAMKIINFKKKDVNTKNTKELKESYENAKICLKNRLFCLKNLFVKKNLKINM